jgi:hypothetical protein
MAKGHIRTHGPSTWELKYDVGTGQALDQVQDGARYKK